MMKTEVLTFLEFTDLGDRIASPVYAGKRAFDYFQSSPKMLDHMKSLVDPCLQLFFFFEDEFSEIPIRSGYICGERNTFQESPVIYDDMEGVFEWLTSGC